MEARDRELTLNDYAEFEQRTRSYTWPERQLAHLEFGAVVEAADSDLSPRGYAPDLLSHESSTNISVASSTNLTETLKSTLKLIPESDCDQELEPAAKKSFRGEKQSDVEYSKKVPFRTQSEMRLSAVDMDNIKSNAGASYPSVSHFSEQNLSGHVADTLPILSLSSHPPLPQAHSQAVSHSTLSVSQNIASTNDSAQLSVLKLVSAVRNTSGILCLAGSGENLSAGPVVPPVHQIIGGSVQNLTVISTDSHTAPSSDLRSANDNSVSIIKSLPASCTVSNTCMGSNIQTNCATSQVLVSTASDLNTTASYYSEGPAEESVEKNLEDNGKQKLIKKKRVRKRVNGLISMKKPNPWGAESYSELISRALKSTFNGRMRLNEIYNWFASNVPYFGSRTSQEQSAGWKNSIRHNLSLHSRFMRIQNEGAGKSSWWVINPDAKPGRNPRRQRSATLETTTKIAMDKKRRGARKKVMEMRACTGGGTLHSAGSSIVGSQVPLLFRKYEASVLSRELYAGEEDSSNFEPFRSRTQSNLSLSGSSSRVSPSMIENYENFDSFDFPPFVEAANAMPHDILDRTNEMNLNQSDSPAFHRPMANPMLNGTSTPTASSLIAHIKTEPSSSWTENSVQPPPSYHELDVVRGVQNIQNPLLRTHLIQNRIPNQQGVPYNGSYSAGSASVASSNWMHSSMIPISVHPSVSCAAQQSFSGNTAALPMDLENLALPDQPLMEVENMEAVIRHELSQSAGSQLSFDNI
uniref:Forkhead box protein O n=1 Tax=Elaeophora elaphi TaxID=1147741 RepID=A0A0R3RXA3_9BILA